MKVMKSIKERKKFVDGLKKYGYKYDGKGCGRGRSWVYYESDKFRVIIDMVDTYDGIMWISDCVRKEVKI